MFGIDPSLLWAVVLLALGIGCLVLEVFVPSGGMLGVLAALSILAAIVLAFLSGPTAGVVMTLAVTLLVPLLMAGAVRYWPETPLGRMILLRRPDQEEVLPETEFYRSLHQLVGQRGVAKSLMLPSGVVSVQGKTYDAVSNGLPIDPGQPVRVIGIDTQRLVVRLDEPIKEPEPETPAASGPTLADAGLAGIEDPFAP